MSEIEITFKTINDETHYSCGCKDKVIGKNYIFLPCSLGCEVYKLVVEKSKELKHEIEYLMVVSKVR